METCTRDQLESTIEELYEDIDWVAAPGVDCGRDHEIFALPKDPNCETCQATRMTEKAAKRHKAGHVDARMLAEHFGDIVHLDTLFLTEGKDGNLEKAEKSTIQLQVFYDQATTDIEVIRTASKAWKVVRDAIIEFGGSRDAITTLYSDRAKEFKRAAKSLGIAPMKTTPGRSTSHSIIERGNKTCLEWGRHGLERSGLGIEWGALCIRHEMMHRRCKPREGELTIYEQRHGNVCAPKLYPFGALVTFKPSNAQQDGAKISPPGKKGLIVGYETQPGGAWSGDYLLVEVKDFEINAQRRNARVFITKTVFFDDSKAPTFPIAEAKKISQQKKLVDQLTSSMQLKENLVPVIEGDESDEEEEDEGEPSDEEPEAPESVEPAPVERSEARVRAPVITKEFINHFRLGGWFRRLPISNPEHMKAPHKDSKRPFDVHPHVWAGIGQYPQNRELECRRLEKEGQGPPTLPEEVFEGLLDEQKFLVTDALIREDDIEKGRINLELSAPSAPATNLAPDGSCMETCTHRAEKEKKGVHGNVPLKQAAVKKKVQMSESSMETCADNLMPEAAVQGGLDLEQVWPEGAKARSSLEEWCEAEGVRGPSEIVDGHRSRKHEPLPGFGLVNKPVAANSPEWKSKAGQSALQDERQKHEKKGTWLCDKVVELSELLKETRASGEEVIIGGVHPVMYEKHSEDPKHAMLRARVVFTAPRARTSSGLDPHTLYNEISSAPVTFQGARTCRAVGAVKGFITSTRDAETAYLQAELKRKNSARTFVALPRCFWPESWGDKYRQPMVPLHLALFGHPEAG